MDPVRLPLFPLPIILFPGTVLPLHIFEPRYRQMVEHVMERDNRFGLLYHDPDTHGPFSNEKGRIGTVAEIRKHNPIPDGCSMILVRAWDGFRQCRRSWGDALYDEATVAPYDDDVPNGTPRYSFGNGRGPCGSSRAFSRHSPTFLRLFPDSS